MARQARLHKKPTQKDVAQASGYSTRTVSLALRNDPSIPKETTREIHEVAQRVGYNRFSEHGQIIGVIVPYIEHFPYSNLASLIREVAFGKAVNTFICESGGNLEVERRIIEEMNRFGFIGLILVSSRLPHDEIDALVLPKRPVVTINMPISEASYRQFGSIEVDNEQGSYEATKYLFEQGCEKVFYLAGRSLSESNKQRQAGYKRAVQEQMRQSEVIKIGMFRPNFLGGYKLTQKLLEAGTIPDAILAYNDLMAIGAMKAIRDSDQTLRIPDDIAVAGFDNISMGFYSFPSLATVKIEWDTIAQEAFDILYRLIQGEKLESEKLHQVMYARLLFKGRDSVPHIN